MSHHLEPRCADLPGGARIEYIEIGSGTPVVYFHSPGAARRDTDFIPALAQQYRVLSLSRPDYSGSSAVCASAREDAQVMAKFIRTVVDGAVHLIAESDGGAVGCWLAILEPALVQSLILVAPTVFASASPEATELLERLGEITAPTLVLWGTADEVIPPESGQIYLRRIPNSYRMLVYGAAHALPVSACHQFVELAADFIQRGDGFVVAEPT